MSQDQQETKVKNKVMVKETGPCKKKVTIEIPENVVTEAVDEWYNTRRKEVVVPGFRRGRAPRRLLEKRFGKEACEQIKLKLLADASDAAIKDEGIEVLVEPEVDHEKIELPSSSPLKFDFEVEVRPEFKLPELEGIAVTTVKLEVTDEQVDSEVRQLQKYWGIWIPREGGQVESGDRVIADAILKLEDVEEEEKLDNIEVFVRENGFVGSVPVPELDKLLAGAKAGDTRKTSITVEKTYFMEEYRGKKVDVEISVKDIKWLKPAELNEELFTRFGVDDEKQLREKLREIIEDRLEQQAKMQMSEQIHQYMRSNTKFELPTSVVADQADNLLRRQFASLMRQGLKTEQLEEKMEQLRAGSEEQAKEQLKTFFIMDKVADELGIEVTEEEINGHIAQAAIRRGQRPEKMREDMLRDGSLGQFRLQIREEKCISKLLESAKITEKKAKKSTKKTAREKAVKKTLVPDKKTTKDTVKKKTSK